MNLQVYIVIHSIAYESSTIVAVKSTFESAQSYMAKAQEDIENSPDMKLHSFTIEGWEVEDES